MNSQLYPNNNSLATTANGVVEIAQLITRVAAFLQAEYCNGGLLAATSQVHYIMRRLHTNLSTYPWLLVNKDDPQRAFLSNENVNIGSSAAVGAMKALNLFFVETAERKRQQGLPDVIIEVSLASDLRFATDYTTLLAARACEQGQFGIREVGGKGKPAPYKSSEPPLGHEPVFNQHHAAGSQQSSVAGAAVGPNIIAQNSSPPKAMDTILFLSPHPDNPDNPSYDVQNRRLARRTRLAGDANFAHIVGKIRQWTSPSPADHTTIHSSRDSSGLWHFCDATVLGIPTVRALKLHHPLDPQELQVLDFDVLRFVRLALWDWVNEHSEQQEVGQSLQVARREIRQREREIRQEKEQGRYDEAGVLGQDIIVPTHLEPLYTGTLDFAQGRVDRTSEVQMLERNSQENKGVT